MDDIAARVSARSRTAARLFWGSIAAASAMASLAALTASPRQTAYASPPPADAGADSSPPPDAGADSSPAEPNFPPLDLRRAQKRTDLPGELELKARASKASIEPTKGDLPTFRPRRGTVAGTLVGHEAVVALAGDRGLVCTGTLIAPKVILTARHCLPVREARFGVDPREPFATSKVKAHRTPPLATLDIALLELARPAEPKPIRLRKESETAPPTSIVRLVGYGAVDAQGERGMAPRHVVDVEARGWGCEAVEENHIGCMARLEMVIPRQGGNDTCAGDSGGPVLESVDGVLQVVAVTSRQVKGSLIACGDGGVYTRVDAAGAWIRQTLGEIGRIP